MLSTARIAKAHFTRRVSAHSIAKPRIALAAIRSLYTELVLAPKPGLVSPLDSGSHRDMDARTLMRSLFSLRHYFRDIALAGMAGLEFQQLQVLGLAAEQRMLRATSGVNSHRGAVFTVGLLAAAAGFLQGQGKSLCGDRLGRVVRQRWGRTLQDFIPQLPSHGLTAACRYGAGGARMEATLGYPSVFEIGLPILQSALASQIGLRRALVQTLFSLMEVLQDTNVLYRGGTLGLRFLQGSARRFIDDGGVLSAGWEARAMEIHRDFVRHNLSPGGSADLLAATWFAHELGAGNQ
jgi:triphosphoribosyl-dephospho-CoA synthase